MAALFHRHVLFCTDPLRKEKTSRHSAYIFINFLVTGSYNGTFISTGYAASTDSFHDTRVCLPYSYAFGICALHTNSFKKKKDKSTDAVEVATEQQSEEAGNEIDAETLDVIEQSVRKYVSASADDGKPHDRIKILSVKEVKND